jgi:hypothetical protein
MLHCCPCRCRCWCGTRFWATRLWVHFRHECNCTATWHSRGTRKCIWSAREPNQSICTSLCDEDCPRLTPTDTHRSNSISRSPRVPTRLPPGTRPYTSASSIHHPFPAKICKHDQRSSTVSSPPCRDIGHREAPRVDSGAQNSARNGIPDCQATCLPSNLPLGSDPTAPLRNEECAAGATTGLRDAMWDLRSGARCWWRKVRNSQAFELQRQLVVRYKPRKCRRWSTGLRKLRSDIIIQRL